MEKVFDLFLFMGQSNMAGRGISNSKWPERAPDIIEGAGYEFRAVSDPEKLYDINEPFGIYENNSEGIWEPGMKTGSMVTSFVNAYYLRTGIPIIGVSASKGGSAIKQWQNNKDYLTDAMERMMKAKRYCEKNNITLRHQYMVWCQGESDGDRGTGALEYKDRFEHMLETMLSSGIEMCFMISIGQYNGAKNTDYEEIIQIQHEIASEHPKVCLVSDDFVKMKERGLMKDEFHYYQAAYNEVGRIAGENTAEYVCNQQYKRELLCKECIKMSHLMKPIQINKLTLHNRLVMPPMATAKAEEDGKVSREVLDYYNEKSQGGYISLIIIEHSFIMQQGKASEKQLSIADDSVVEGLMELSKTIHKNGSKAVMQLNHAGSAAKFEVTGKEVVGPSAVANPRIGNIPKELAVDEIQDIVNAFKEAARRTKAAGFDGVEIHSAHGYLLNQFFSPLSNKRTDEYGGDVKGRIKIHLEVIKAIREAVGEEFPILLRLGAADYMEGGSTAEDSKIAAVEFQKAGVDILDISGGFNGYIVPGAKEQGYFSPLTEAIKGEVSVPVILTGGITDVGAAEKLLQEEKADFIGVGRAIYKDSNWAKNAIESLK